MAINIAAVAEGLILGKKAGVDPKNILNAIKSGLAGSQCLNNKAPRMFTGNYEPGFRMKFHPPLSTCCFKGETESLSLIKVGLPTLRMPD